MIILCFYWRSNLQKILKWDVLDYQPQSIIETQTLNSRYLILNYIISSFLNTCIRLFFYVSNFPTYSLFSLFMDYWITYFSVSDSIYYIWLKDKFGKFKHWLNYKKEKSSLTYDQWTLRPHSLRKKVLRSLKQQFFYFLFIELTKNISVNMHRR